MHLARSKLPWSSRRANLTEVSVNPTSNPCELLLGLAKPIVLHDGWHGSRPQLQLLLTLNPWQKKNQLWQIESFRRKEKSVIMPCQELVQWTLQVRIQSSQVRVPRSAQAGNHDDNFHITCLKPHRRSWKKYFLKLTPTQRTKHTPDMKLRWDATKIANSSAAMHGARWKPAEQLRSTRSHGWDRM